MPLVPWTSDTQCDNPTDPSTTMFSIFVSTGVVVTYLPQLYRIIANKTSEGFSAWFLLLGAISSVASLLNIILLQWEAFVCCRSLSAGGCLVGLLGVIQIALQCTGFTSIFVLFLVYFPEQHKYVPRLSYTQPGSKLDRDLSRPWKEALGVAVIFASVTVTFIIISILMVAIVGSPAEDWKSNYWAGLLGILSMAFGSLQYFPQIWTTWKRKTVGALSIPMMLMQTPGSLLFVYTIAVRPGTNWTAWITYLVAGALQGTLLVLCITWTIRNKRLGIDEIQGQAADDEASRPLLNQDVS